MFQQVLSAESTPTLCRVLPSFEVKHSTSAFAGRLGAELIGMVLPKVATRIRVGQFPRITRIREYYTRGSRLSSRVLHTNTAVDRINVYM